MINFFAGVVAVAKAIPALKAILDQFHNYYLDYRINELEQVQSTSRAKRLVVMAAIKGAKTDEERKILSVVLSDITR